MVVFNLPGAQTDRANPFSVSGRGPPLFVAGSRIARRGSSVVVHLIFSPSLQHSIGAQAATLNATGSKTFRECAARSRRMAINRVNILLFVKLFLNDITMVSYILLS